MNLCSNDKPSLTYIPPCDKKYNFYNVEAIRIERNALNYVEELKIQAESGFINLEEWVIEMDGNKIVIIDKKN